MEMFLMVLSLSVVGVVVSGLLFAAATRQPWHGEGRVFDPVSADEERFFMLRPAAVPPGARARVPADVLILQIERHVRLEHAAAESFLQVPSVEALHMATLSPLTW